jgi:AcrR family transcriptional regulator
VSKIKDTSAEERILAAAQAIFTQKGFAGTRMQEIADAAGINKAMLHYYFRSKEKLFRVVLTNAIQVIVPLIIEAISSDKDVLSKLEDLVSSHLAELLERPYLPLFVMHELSQNQGKFITDIFEKSSAQPVMLAFFQEIVAEADAGKIRKVDPIHLLMNTMSMIVFPFIARPMLAAVTGVDREMLMPILEQRKVHVIEFLRAALKP